MLATAGSTSENAKASNLRVSVTVWPYSARVTTTVFKSEIPTEAGFAVSVRVAVFGARS